MYPFDCDSSSSETSPPKTAFGWNGTTSMRSPSRSFSVSLWRRQMPRGVLRDPDRALHEPTVRRRVQDRDDGRGQDDEGGDGWIGRGVGEDGELGFDDGVEGGHVGDVGA